MCLSREKKIERLQKKLAKKQQKNELDTLRHNLLMADQEADVLKAAREDWKETKKDRRHNKQIKRDERKVGKVTMKTRRADAKAAYEQARTNAYEHKAARKKQKLENKRYSKETRKFRTIPNGNYSYGYAGSSFGYKKPYHR